MACHTCPFCERFKSSVAGVAGTSQPAVADGLSVVVCDVCGGASLFTGQSRGRVPSQLEWSAILSKMPAELVARRASIFAARGSQDPNVALGGRGLDPRMLS